MCVGLKAFSCPERTPSFFSSLNILEDAPRPLQVHGIQAVCRQYQGGFEDEPYPVTSVPFRTIPENPRKAQTRPFGKKSSHQMPSLAPDLFGKILLSRFLELPLRRFDSFVKTLDADPELHRLSGVISPDVLDGARLSPSPPPEIRIYGEIVLEEGLPDILWHSPSFVREYRMDDAALVRMLEIEGRRGSLGRVVRRLRLVNSRNRLAHSFVRFVLRTQAGYLESGDPLRLHPLSHLRIAGKLPFNPWFPRGIDSSRLSRILRHFPLVFPEGKVRELSDLCPNSRTIGCHFVNGVIKSEKPLILEGAIKERFSDEEIARRLEERGLRISRRTVAHIRRTLGIPASGDRAGKRSYRDATEDFSPPLVLTARTVREQVPDEAGVYEIRSSVPGASEEIVYLGSAGNLRKRLIYHIQATRTNPLLRKRIEDGARVRYRCVKENWRTTERDIYRAFLATYGKPPECNRVSP